ncbi:hypothetical protein LINPERPRIM_LOCUS30665, partial [Linum perenne]
MIAMSFGGVGSGVRATTIVGGIEEIGVCLVVGREEEMGRRWWCWKCGGGGVGLRQWWWKTEEEDM